jgi:CRISPR-associated protein (TIGR02710 family)
MNKALILTIGTGSGVENGLAFSIKQQNPNYIFFIYSKDSKTTLDKVLEKIENIEYHSQLFEEINDVESIYKEYIKYIEILINKGYSAAEIVADYTSGTKSMSAALVSAAISKEIGTLSYVYGTRENDAGRVISNTERTSQLKPNFIFTEQKIKLFKKLFNKNQFENALLVFSDENIHIDLKSEVEFLKKLAQVYSAWDRFEFKNASDEINQIDLEIAKKFKIKKTIEEHKKILHSLKVANDNSKLSDLDVKDLYSNAIRRFNEGKYDDSVSRLYRLIEMIGQIEFVKEFNTSNSDLSYDLLPEDMKGNFDGKEKNSKIELGLNDTFRMLKIKDNPQSLIYFNNIEQIKKLLSTRNYSRLAHGQRPIGKDNCKKFIDFISESFKIKNEIMFPEIN